MQTWLRFCVAVAVCRLAAAALIGPLAWELPYAMGVAIKSQKTNKQTKKPHTRGNKISPETHMLTTPSPWDEPHERHQLRTLMKH